MRDVVRASAAVLLFATPTVANAGCYTGNDGCIGYKTIKNTWSEVRCFSLRNKQGGTHNFCLSPGEERRVKVVSGDYLCAVKGNVPVPTNCNMQYIYTD